MEGVNWGRLVPGTYLRNEFIVLLIHPFIEVIRVREPLSRDQPLLGRRRWGFRGCHDHIGNRNNCIIAVQTQKVLKNISANYLKVQTLIPIWEVPPMNEDCLPSYIEWAEILLLRGTRGRGWVHHMTSLLHSLHNNALKTRLRVDIECC